jgi:hypothetical protein
MDPTSSRYPPRYYGTSTSGTTPAACAAPCRGHSYTRTSGVTNSPAAPWATSAAKGRRPTTCSSASYPTTTQRRFTSTCVRRPGAKSSSRQQPNRRLALGPAADLTRHSPRACAARALETIRPLPAGRPGVLCRLCQVGRRRPGRAARGPPLIRAACSISVSPSGMVSLPERRVCGQRCPSTKQATIGRSTV